MKCPNWFVLKFWGHLCLACIFHISLCKGEPPSLTHVSYVTLCVCGGFRKSNSCVDRGGEVTGEVLLFGFSPQRGLPFLQSHLDPVGKVEGFSFTFIWFITLKSHLLTLPIRELNLYCIVSYCTCQHVGVAGSNPGGTWGHPYRNAIWLKTTSVRYLLLIIQ